MAQRLFLLDGMALAYRAHFAFINRPIRNSQGMNTSAVFGYTNTLLDIIQNQNPTHLAVAFDTPEPTARHIEYAPYKAQREAMPEELSAALPYVFKVTEAFNIPVIRMPGFEADDVIGTLAKQADAEDFETYMVTPDKDFGQLVTARTFLYKPARMGNEIEIMGVPEILARWQIERVSQVIDMLGLMGDASDNIPGIPGIGEKTAQKLIAQFGSVEGLLENVAQLKGKQREKVDQNREQALLSKRLATIDCEVPVGLGPKDLVLSEPNRDALSELFAELEFNTLGKRVLGDGYKAGRGFQAQPAQGDLFDTPTPAALEEKVDEPAGTALKTIADVEHSYRLISGVDALRTFAEELRTVSAFCFDVETTGLDTQTTDLVGIAFSWEAHRGAFVSIPADAEDARRMLDVLSPVFADESISKIGHNLKFDLSVMKWQGVEVRGTSFDTMLAHSLIDPETKHGMDFLSERYLGYSPVPITELIGEKKSDQISMREVPLEKLVEYATEDADVTWQLYELLKPMLDESGQKRVFDEIESPLLPALVDMEYEGIALNSKVLAEYSVQLEEEIVKRRERVFELAGREFNLNSPKQLGQVLFDEMKLIEKPKKTKTGQYSTNEQVLQTLASKHEIIQQVLDFRELTKLKSTYVDALPETVSKKTGRVHTSFGQTHTATGRLQSQNPNLQNIPIRTELGREIRKAFIPRSDEYELLSADYSQIELRIIAALSEDEGMRADFEAGHDIHAATAAKVYGVSLNAVQSDMRRKAKMVNFGIAYGISAFGLAQRLDIPRAEAAEIIDQYFRQYPGIRKYMDSTIELARKNGYVETVTGRRRYLRDINSANGTIRAAAERNAINSPIQGTAADMIKLAMSSIHREIETRRLRSRMLLQVHDELIFDLHLTEKEEMLQLVENGMKNALPLDVPILVEMGTGRDWLAAH